MTYLPKPLSHLNGAGQTGTSLGMRERIGIGEVSGERHLRAAPFAPSVLPSLSPCQWQVYTRPAPHQRSTSIGSTPSRYRPNDWTAGSGGSSKASETASDLALDWARSRASTAAAIRAAVTAA